MTRQAEQERTRRKRTGAHFTPGDLARLLAKRLLGFARLGDRPRPARVLDPACGDGALLVAIRDELCARGSAGGHLVGIDSDIESARVASVKVGGLPGYTVNVIPGDFLDVAAGLRAGELRMTEAAPAPMIRELDRPFDLVLANPPYVRTQVLGSKRARSLAEAFGLSGRVDLYQAFIVAITQFLRPGGHLGIITSNRYLTTRTGEGIRAFIGSHYDILEVVDLGDTKLFEAAVLPSLLFARRRPDGLHPKHNGTAKPRFIRVYESTNRTNGRVRMRPSMTAVLEEASSGVYEVGRKMYDVTAGELQIPGIRTEPWRMLTPAGRRWLRRVDEKASFRVRDVASVKVGLKTTADDVFIRSDWDDLPAGVRPEPELLRPILRHEQMGRWIPNRQAPPSFRVLYTHVTRDGRRQPIDLRSFPRARAYLYQHRRRLESRRYVLDAGRRWYEIWVPQDPDSWGRPKVVVPDISPEPRFSFDSEGWIVDGDCYWVQASAGAHPDILFLLLAVANSKLGAKYHDLAFQNMLYSGRRRHMTQFVENYPLPDPHMVESLEAVRLVRRLIAKTGPQGELEAELDRAVVSAFRAGGIPS